MKPGPTVATSFVVAAPGRRGDQQREGAGGGEGEADAAHGDSLGRCRIPTRDRGEPDFILRRGGTAGSTGPRSTARSSASSGFADFAEALAFVNRVGALAEAEGHHPDIAIHWNRVTLRWWTHVRDAITERDHELARRTNEVWAHDQSLLKRER